MTRFFLYGAVFFTGAVILTIEIVGTRVLAPFYGSTIYVWSSLITVTLLALALGYFFGGRLADRRPHMQRLFTVLFFSGILVLLIPSYASVALHATNPLGIRLGPLTASLLLFAPPIFLLGIVSPFAVKLATRSLQKLGVTAGNLYALSTIGSLAGGLFTGFYLVATVKPAVILVAVGLTLIALFFLWHLFTRSKK